MADMNAAHAALDRIVRQGRERAKAGLEALAKEWGIRHDLVAKPEAIDVEFKVVGEEPQEGEVPARTEMRVKVGSEDSFGLTPHARGQLLSRASVPLTFADTLTEHGLTDLLRFNIQRLLPRVSKEGLLVREVGGVAKGILSTSYRRMDASPLFEEYATTAIGSGLVPWRGEVTDTRAFLAFIRPEVEEVTPGEFVVYGHELRNSDYGRGALELNLSILRVLCTNGMIGFDLMRKVHLGRRFDAAEFEGTGGVVRLSQRTIDLDVRTLRSGLRDTLKSADTHLRLLGTSLREKAAVEKVDVREAMARLRASGVRKSTTEKVKALYEEASLPVESVPQAPGAWRLANVISMLANGEKDGDDAADLRAAAFDVLSLPAIKAA